MKQISKTILFFICAAFLFSDVVRAKSEFKLGLENIPDTLWAKLHPQGKQSCRVGLITNATGVDQQGRRNIDLLRADGVQINFLFAPEHGFDGATKAGTQVHNGKDKKTGLPVVSLYGNWSGKALGADYLNKLDALIYDMQDVGMRHYTYISTLFQAIDSAAQHNKPLVVLDRPNPLGARMEGPMVSDEIQKLRSFLAAAPIPLRHGMTVGELARYYNAQVLNNKAQVHVVPMHGYARTDGLLSLPVGLSPNIATLDACYGYSFLGLLAEVRPFDMGVGTEKAFQCLAVWDRIRFDHTKWDKLAKIVDGAGVATKPHALRRRKHMRPGLQFAVRNINDVASFDLFLRLCRFFKKHGIAIRFSEHFDRVAGTSQVRAYLEGNKPHTQFVAMINKDLHNFFAKARTAFLYQPLPTIGELQ